MNFDEVFFTDLRVSDSHRLEIHHLSQYQRSIEGTKPRSGELDRQVGGGTDEVMKNIIGERVLGRPGDLRADRGIAFNKIPTRL